MGSLVPGWDADIGVPRDLVPDNDIEKEQQPLGYFAKLRSLRHNPDVTGDQAATQSLARVSAPQSLSRSASARQGPVPRANTLSHGGVGVGPHKYQLTDWTSELTSLRPRGLARTSLGSLGDGHEHGHQEAGAWWRSLEVGQLNEHPDAASNFVHGTQHSTFMPQFTQSSSLRFGDMDGGDGGEDKK